MSRVDRIGNSLRNIRTFSSLKNPSYRLYYGGMFGQWLSVNMQGMAFTLLVYRLSGSTAVLGLMFLVYGLPALFMGSFGGVIADRMPKKHVMLIGLVSASVVNFGIAVALDMGYLSAERVGSWRILLVTAALQGTISGFTNPAFQAIIPEIVSKEQVTNAIALNNMASNALRLFAPAATGFLIDAFDFTVAYYIIAGLYFAGVAFIALIPPTRRISSRGRGTLADLVEGFHYLRHETILFLILGFTLVGVMLTQPYMSLLPVFAEDILKVGAKGMGILMSVSGVGAIIGSLTLASLPARKRGLMLLLGSVILGLALMGFAFSSSWHFSLAMMVLLGLGQALRMTLGNALLQSYVETQYRGRVMSFYMMEMGLGSISVFVAGLLAEAVGAPWVVGGFAMALVLLSFLALAFVPRVRRLD